MPVFYATLDPKGILSGAVEGERAVKRLGNSFDDMQGKGVKAASAVSDALTGMAKVAVGAFAGFKAFDIGKNATLAAGRYEMLGVAMYQVGQNAGYTRTELDAFAASMEKTGIAMTESRQIITRLASANVDLAKASDLARIAQDAAVIGGINSTEAFERLVHGVTTAQTEVLRTIGIQVNFEAAYAKTAARLGKTTSALSENEKMQARVNAVQEQGVKISGAYEASLDSAYKKMTSMPRYLDNIEVLAGKLGAGLFSDFIEGAYDAAKATESWLKSMDKAGELESYGKNIASGIKEVAGYVDDAAVAFIAYQAATKGAAAASVLFSGGLAQQIAMMRGAVTQAGLLRAATTALSGLWPLALAGGVAAIYHFATAQTEAERLTRENSAAIDEMAASANGASVATDRLTKSIKEMSATQARIQLFDAQEEIALIESQIDSLKEMQSNFASSMADIPLDSESPFAAWIEAFQNSSISAEQFRGRMVDLMSVSDAADKKTAKTLIDLSYLWERNTYKVKLLTGRVQENSSALDSWGKAADALSKSSDAVGEALRKMDEAAQPKTLEDAYSIYNKYIDAGDKAKSTATENAQAQARLAVELLKKTAAAEDAAGAMAIMAGMDAQAAEQAGLAAQYFQKAIAHYANARRLMADADALEVKIPEIKVGGGGGGLSENRAVEQAQDAYKKALDSAEQLRLKNIELAHSFSGDTLASSIAKVEREYSAQISNLDKDLTDLLRKQAEWQKKGLYTSEVAGFVQQYREQVDLARKELDVQREINVALEKRKSIESSLGFSLNEEDRMLEKMGALAAAYDMGAISLEQYQLRLTNVGLEIAKLHQMEGFSTWNEDLSLALGGMVQGYEGVAAGLSNTWGNFFTSFTQGFSNSIGQAIVMGASLEQSLRNVGQNAIAGLISSLMQLGIQWAVNAAIGQGIAAASSAATIAMGTATGAALTAAYTPAAVMASLMSFGGNSAPAIAGMTATYAAATMMSSIGSSIGSSMGSFGLGGGSYTSALAGMGPGMASGGYTGDYPKNKITNFVHGGEYVFSADAVDRLGLPFLEALHRGDAKGFASGGYVGGGQSASAAALYSGSAFGNLAAPSAGRGGSGGGAPFKLIIEQKGTPQTYEVEYVTADEARIIARDEARSVVRSDSPGIVRNTFSGDMAQPNSTIAKSVSRNLKSERRR